jgi:hypothetical protein
VWVDNETIVVTLTGIGGLLPCMDLYTREQAAPNPFRVVDVEGTAWDPLIIAGNDAVPSSNFARYLIDFQKQGAAGWVTLVDSADPVPGRLDPVGVGVLQSWDLSMLDAPSNALLPPADQLPADQLLDPNESCAYLVRLRAWDRTLLNDGSSVHWSEDFFPVKIINSPLP